ncbi:MAG: hypothetical protein GC156_10905 [Actinomycetales bacterium]|nr:hypothetical protein [Actinomycetales bacterium]
MSASIVHSREIALTADGARLLSDRVTDIRDRQIPALRPFLYGPDRDEAAVTQFEDLLAEVTRMDGVLARARILDEPAGSTVVLGSRVRIRLADGSRAWVRPVHPEEAALDDERISVESPLGRALMGARAGDEVPVDAPAGRWTCTVLDVPRPRASRKRRG